MASIIITSPHKQFTEMVKTISEELKIETFIVESVLEEASDKVAEICNENNISVIVSRGGTARAISKTVTVPVITAEANDFDILKALWEAKNYSNKICYLSYDYKDNSDFGLIEKILGVRIEQLFFTTKDELKKKIKKAKEMGLEAMVSGSSLAIELSMAEGLKGILLETSRRTMIGALQRAKLTEEIRNKDRKNTAQLNTILHLSNDGIVVLDEMRNIQLVNPMAEKIFNTKNSDVTGRKIKAIQDNIDERDLINDKENIYGKVIKIHSNNVVVSSAPLSTGKNNYGYVIYFKEVSKIQELEQNVRRQIHLRGHLAKYSFEDIIGSSEAITNTIKKAKKFSGTESTVLITGESGTGKELFAQSIHNLSKRKSGPFVAVNCAAIPESLLESELFGYEEGAFTGAKKGGKQGLFELAHNGTLFLDEMEALKMNLQSRLLRVLQEKQIIRIGSDKVIPIDVRVIAATNENLRNAVKAGEFREDLYYRLNILNLEIPPLRDRKGDLKDLVKHSINIFNDKFDKNVTDVSDDLMELFEKYNWPGNVRELMNCLERMIVLAEDTSVGVEDVMIDFPIDEKKSETVHEGQLILPKNENTIFVIPGKFEDMEDQIIAWYNKKYKGNKGQMANELGICRTTLWKKLKKTEI